MVGDPVLHHQLEGAPPPQHLLAGGAPHSEAGGHQEAWQGLPPCGSRDLPGECGAWPVEVECGEEVPQLYLASHKHYLLQG